MKKFITILISCSLALAASAIAQQDAEQQKPQKEKSQPAKSHTANEAKPALKPQSVPREHAHPDADELALQLSHLSHRLAQIRGACGLLQRRTQAGHPCGASRDQERGGAL